MAIFAGNFLCKASFGLQSRIILIPWMKKSSGIRCSNGRANCSSFPVRYIPKKTTKTEEPQKKTLKTKEPQTSPTPRTGHENKSINNGLDQTELRFEVTNGGKRSSRTLSLHTDPCNQNNYFTYGAIQDMEEEIDYDEGFVELECIEEPAEVIEELGIYHGKNPRSQDELQSGKTEQDAEKLAAELLARRAYTAVQLRKKLQGKRFPLDTVDAVVKDFQSRGFINDGLYAESFSRSKWSSSTWGPRRIKQALSQKGVREVDVTKAIKLVFQDGDSGEEHESRHGLSKVSMDQLFVQASKQWLRGQDVTIETRKTRIVRWLQYRGFNWDVIITILKKLESAHAR